MLTIYIAYENADLAVSRTAHAKAYVLAAKRILGMCGFCMPKITMPRGKNRQKMVVGAVRGAENQVVCKYQDIFWTFGKFNLNAASTASNTNKFERPKLYIPIFHYAQL